MALTGAIKGSSRDKLYHELRLEYFQQIKRIRRLCLLCKFLLTEQASHIHNLFPHIFTDAQTLSTYLLVEMNTSKIHFFPQVSNERNKFDTNIRRSINYDIFCNALLKFLRSFKKKIFHINDPLRKKKSNKIEIRFYKFRDLVSLILILIFTLSLFRSSIYLVGHCSMLIQVLFFVFM